MHTPRWWALVGQLGGPAPTGVITAPYDRGAVLDRIYAVGPLRLRPGGKQLVEYVRTEPQALAGVAVIESWPIIVEGSEASQPRRFDPGLSPEWPDIEQSGCESLHRLCGLLSVAWGEPWQVRTSPKPTAQLPPEVPNSWPPPPTAPTREPWREPHRRGLPKWISVAWDRLDQDDALEAGLAAWHQGVLLMSLFPSYALVAFLGSMENVGRSSAFASDLEDASATANARVRAALALVSSDQEMDQFEREWNVLKKRGSVAHGGKTHGIETTLGRVFLFQYQPPTEDREAGVSIDERDPAQVFMLNVLPTVARKARELLEKALSNGAAEMPQAE